MVDVVIKDLSPEQLLALTRALTDAGVKHSTSQMFFTVDEAQALLEELGARQRQLVESVARGTVFCPMRSCGLSMRRLCEASAVRSPRP